MSKRDLIESHSNFVRKGHYSIREILDPNGIYGRWNWRGLTAYGAGFAAMLVGLPVSALVYQVACRSMDLQQDARMAAHADEGLESEATGN